VFIREAAPEDTGAASAATVRINDPLLPPGARLMARLESAATTAVDTPVVASIEYNYERSGMTVVPAGTKAIGDIQQASAEERRPSKAPRWRWTTGC
jgi:hypothetical protein